MTKITSILIVFLLFFSLQAKAIEKKDVIDFNQQNHLGIRLGAWSNSGGLPPAAYLNSDTTALIQTKIKDASFYFEGYYGHRFANYLVGELSLGIVNRGTVTIEEQNQTDIGNFMIYPILFQAKIYPFANMKSSFNPYFLAGGGFYYSRISVQFTTSYYQSYRNEKSEVDINYVIGGGLDYKLSKNIGIELNAKYFPINMSDPILTVKDHSAAIVTIGIKYLFKNKKKDK